MFASPIVSITVTFVALFGAFAFSGAALTIWQSIAPGHEVAAVAIWFPVSTLIVLFVTIRLVPRWLTRVRLESTGVYFGTMLIAGLLPCVLGLSLGFLQIPSVAWQGTPLEQIKPVDWTGRSGCESLE